MLDVLRVDDKKFSLSLSLYFGVVWKEHRLHLPPPGSNNSGASWLPIDLEFMSNLWVRILFLSASKRQHSHFYRSFFSVFPKKNFHLVNFVIPFYFVVQIIFYSFPKKKFYIWRPFFSVFPKKIFHLVNFVISHYLLYRSFFQFSQKKFYRSFFSVIPIFFPFSQFYHFSPFVVQIIVIENP